MKILIIGNGWIGKRCHEAWSDSVLADTRIQSATDLLKLLDEHKPDAVLNAAGIVGKPNVDWCEDHQLETIQGNTVLPILIAEACQQKNIYLLHIGTGCVFYGYASDPNGPPRLADGSSSGEAGWKESDTPNPSAVYTRTKYAADLVLSTLPNIGIARIRMPIDSIPSPVNLIDKLARYTKVADVINSATVIEDMAHVFRQLLEKRAVGIFHVTNPGAIRHKEIMAMYKELVNPSHHNDWITEKELVSQGLAKKIRSNTILQSPNLEKLGIKMRPIHEAVRDAMEKYAKLLKKY